MLGSGFAFCEAGGIVGTAGSASRASGPRGVMGAGVRRGDGGSGVLGGWMAARNSSGGGDGIRGPRAERSSDGARGREAPAGIGFVVRTDPSFGAGSVVRCLRDETGFAEGMECEGDDCGFCRG